MLKLENAGRFAPPILFDPALQAWTLDLHNAHTLSDIQLAERMLPDGSTAVPRIEMERMLRSTAADRTTTGMANTKAEDAQLTINGLAVKSASNNVANGIDGVTLN
ncbi:hypothetical protein SB758_32985, partial [Burkholderia sp. SIMBA_013]